MGLQVKHGSSPFMVSVLTTLVAQIGTGPVRLTRIKMGPGSNYSQENTAQIQHNGNQPGVAATVTMANSSIGAGKRIK